MAVSVDPAALQVMRMSSELATMHDVVRRQRRLLWGLAAALRAERAASGALVDLVDELLGGRNEWIRAGIFARLKQLEGKPMSQNQSTARPSTPARHG